MNLKEDLGTLFAEFERQTAKAIAERKAGETAWESTRKMIRGLFDEAKAVADTRPGFGAIVTDPGVGPIALRIACNGSDRKSHCRDLRFELGDDYVSILQTSEPDEQKRHSLEKFDTIAVGRIITDFVRGFLVSLGLEDAPRI